MKFFAVLAAASIAVALAQTPNCDTAALVGIASGANGAACLSETKYSPATLLIPTGDALVKVCSNKNCQALLGEMAKAIPTECLFSGVPVKSTLLDKFGPACAAALKSASTTTAPPTTTAAPATTTTAPATTAPASTKPATTAPATTKPATNSTATPTSTTAAPTNTTSAPPATPMPESTGSGSMEEETGGSIESAGSIESPGSIDEVATVTKAPASTTAAPKASGSASIATAAGVVVAAVIASLF